MFSCDSCVVFSLVGARVLWGNMVMNSMDCSTCEHYRRDCTLKFEEISRLRVIIKRAKLAVTVTGLTVLGMENACKQAKDILSEA